MFLDLRFLCFFPGEKLVRSRPQSGLMVRGQILASLRVWGSPKKKKEPASVFVTRVFRPVWQHRLAVDPRLKGGRHSEDLAAGRAEAELVLGSIL
jgi:hypothetical protein